MSHAPTITMIANPTKMVPGQPSTISYSANNMSSGDYVNVVGTGGANSWNANNMTSTYNSYSEVENPSAGQTTTVNYTATVYSSTGQALSSATLSVSWTNSWTGTINLNASPLYLPVGSATTLTATGSTPIPSGYSLYIKDVSTGQVVANTGASPTQTRYTSYSAETDQFVAYVYDEYVTVGNNSNTVSVVWSALSLSASPTMLPINNTSTLTVTGQNVPTGQYLIIYDQTIGQVVGFSQSTPYSVTQTKSNPETDTYVAYINSSATPIGAYATSNPVNVDWYSVMLTASPTSLPVGNTSTLTASAQNIPNGYVIDILDQTNNTVIATGRPGQTTVQALQTKSVVETDKYVAQVVQPSNPPIPGLTVPGSSDGGTFYVGGAGSVYQWNGTSFVSIGGPGGNAKLAYGDGALYAATPTSAGSPLQVYKYNGSTWTNLNFVGTWNGTWGIAYDTNSHQLWVASGSWNTSDVAIWNGASWIQQPSPNGGVEVLAFDPTNNYIWAGLGNWQGVQIWHSTYWVSVGAPIQGWQGDINDLKFDQYDNTMWWANVWWGDNGGSSNGNPAGADSINSNFSGLRFDGTPDGNTTNNLVLAYDGQLGYMVSGNADGTVTYYNSSLTIPAWLSLGSPKPGYAVTGVFYDGSQLWATTADGSNYTWSGGTSWTYRSAIGGASDSFVSVPYSGTTHFPYWMFQHMPSYVPTSLFPQQAVMSGNGSGGMWTSGQANVPNGTAFFESTFSFPSAQQAIVSIPNGLDDYEQIYVDGQPVLQNGGPSSVTSLTPSVPIGSSTTLTLPAGMHQVIIEGQNNDGFGASSDNPASVSARVTGQSGQIFVSNASSAWMTTGYITELPAGWFSGAIGKYNFTEDIMQTGQSNPIYQQQSYTVQTIPQNVDVQSLPIPVSWYNPIIAPDNFNLQALPSNVTYPGSTQFKVTFDQSDINFVNQEFGGTSKVVVRAVQTWQPVATGTWTPNTNGSWVAIPYTPVGGTSLQYVAFLVDPKKNVPVAVSNQVTVTDTGHGITGNSYTTTSCSALGNGTEIFNTYTNGTLTKTKTLPLTMQNLEVDGIFNATQQLHTDLGTVIHLPVTNAEVGYGPVPLRVQAPFAFAIQFPDAQPTTVTATFSVNEHDTVDVNGDTSWTVKMHPATNLPYGFWQGETVMPKLPNGDHISVQITATDDCGSASTPTGVFPYDDFVTTNGRPQWYFVQPVKP